MRRLHLPFRLRLSKYTKRLIFVFIVTLLALYIDLPTIPLTFSIAGKTYNVTLQHPEIKIGNFRRDLEPKLGLDLQGGTQVTLEADMTKIDQAKRQEALESVRNVIERRVNLFGVSEPVVQTSKAGETYRVIVELAGVKDVNEAVSLVGQTAKLEFRQIADTPEATNSAFFPTQENTLPTGLGGEDLENAQVVFDPQTGQPQVAFTINKNSQDKFFQKTTELTGLPMLIFLDDTFVSGPRVNNAIRDSGVISGGGTQGFTVQEAKQLALQLNAGALQAPVHIVSQRNIGATLGEQSIRKSIIAGIVGLSVIAIFMIVSYGWLGVVANLALIVYTLITFALFKLLGVTLTLAGIAGFILSIGMAVDANILIFERMKEEIRWGKDKKTALRLGFERAMSSIKASNISTLITTLILYWFGTGFVKGFALTLAVGVLVSMFSAIYVARTFLQTFLKSHS